MSEKLYRILERAILALAAGLVVVFFLGIGLALNAEEEKPRLRETEWSKIIAEEKGGVAEFRLPDQSRVDVLTESTAYEVEWVEKWPEAIGQALFYGLSTDRAPGIILLMRGSKAEENYLECLSVVSALRQHFPIRLETIETE